MSFFKISRMAMLVLLSASFLSARANEFELGDWFQEPELESQLNFPSLNYYSYEDELYQLAAIVGVDTRHLTKVQKSDLDVLSKHAPNPFIREFALEYLLGEDSPMIREKKDAETRSHLLSFPSVNYDITLDAQARSSALLDLETDHLSDKQKQELDIIAKTDPNSFVREIASKYLAGGHSPVTLDKQDAEERTSLQNLTSINYGANRDEPSRLVDLMNLDTKNLDEIQKAQLKTVSETDPSDRVREMAKKYLAGEHSSFTMAKIDAEKRKTLKSFPSVNYDITQEEGLRISALFALDTAHLTPQQIKDLEIIATTDPSETLKKIAADYLSGIDSPITEKEKKAAARQNELNNKREEIEKILVRLQQLGISGNLSIGANPDGTSTIDSEDSMLQLPDGEVIRLID